MTKLGGPKGIHLRFGREEVTVWEDGRIQWGYNSVTTQSDVSLLLRVIFEAGRKDVQEDLRSMLGLSVRDHGVVGVDP